MKSIEVILIRTIITFQLLMINVKTDSTLSSGVQTSTSQGMSTISEQILTTHTANETQSTTAPTSTTTVSEIPVISSTTSTSVPLSSVDGHTSTVIPQSTNASITPGVQTSTSQGMSTISEQILTTHTANETQSTTAPTSTTTVSEIPVISSTTSTSVPLSSVDGHTSTVIPQSTNASITPGTTKGVTQGNTDITQKSSLTSSTGRIETSVTTTTTMMSYRQVSTDSTTDSQPVSTQVSLTSMKTNTVSEVATSALSITKTSTEATEAITVTPVLNTSTIFVGRVSTVFEVKAIMYSFVTQRYLSWSDNYSDTKSSAYSELSRNYCGLILDSLNAGNSRIFQGSTCTSVIFKRISVNLRSKRQVNSVLSDGVQASGSIESKTLSASQLDQSQFSEVLISGYKQLNLSSGYILNGIESTRISPTITCEQTQSLCGQHASCRNTNTGVTCSCDPMWKDSNPDDPGKECTLHPGTIALIVFAAILLLLAVAAIIYFVLRTESVKKLRVKRTM